MKKKMVKILGALVLVSVLVALDQWVKAWAYAELRLVDSIVWIEDVFELVYVENRGSAFGMLQNQMWLFFTLTPISFLLIGYALWRVPDDKKFWPVNACLLLILAGAAGNFIDRISRGFVVDLFYFKPIDFPVFNVADCYIVVGVISLIFILVFWGEALDAIFPEKKKQVEETTDGADM